MNIHWVNYVKTKDNDAPSSPPNYFSAHYCRDPGYWCLLCLRRGHSSTSPSPQLCAQRCHIRSSTWPRGFRPGELAVGSCPAHVCAAGRAGAVAVPTEDMPVPRAAAPGLSEVSTGAFGRRGPCDTSAPCSGRGLAREPSGRRVPEPSARVVPDPRAAATHGSPARSSLAREAPPGLVGPQRKHC